MSYTITTDIFCDGCGAWEEENSVWGDKPLKALARRMAKKHGWVREDGRDLCPACQPKFTLDEPPEGVADSTYHYR